MVTLAIECCDRPVVSPVLQLGYIFDVEGQPTMLILCSVLQSAKIYRPGIIRQNLAIFHLIVFSATKI